MIARRPFTSGKSTDTRRSNRPGRTSAASSMSARFVAASTSHQGVLLDSPSMLLNKHNDAGNT